MTIINHLKKITFNQSLAIIRCSKALKINQRVLVDKAAHHLDRAVLDKTRDMVHNQVEDLRILKVEVWLQDFPSP